MLFWSLTLHYPKYTVALLPAPITALSSGIQLWTVTIILERAPLLRAASQPREDPSCSLTLRKEKAVKSLNSSKMEKMRNLTIEEMHSADATRTLPITTVLKKKEESQSSAHCSVNPHPRSAADMKGYKVCAQKSSFCG